MLTGKAKEEQIKDLEDKIQEEIYRLQMLDYLRPSSYDYLKKMQEDLRELKKQ